MSTASNIEWTDATWNPVTGCTRVSAGCDHCYAVTMTHRLEGMGQAKYAGLTVLNPRGERHFNGVVRCHEDALEVPLKWKTPRLVFVNSMSDLFHEKVPFEFIDRVFAVMALCPRHTFQVLTKRPGRMAEYLAALDVNRIWRCVGKLIGEDAFTKRDAVLPHGSAEESAWWDEGGPLPNVWLGTSVEDQAAADERIPHLLKCPAAVRFLSCEPLLGAVNLSAFFGGPYVGLPGDKVHENYNFGIHWVIVGGESGKGARPCNVAWELSIVGQCRAAGVPVFVKQVGARPIGVCPCKADDGDPHQGCPACGGDGAISLHLHDPKGSNWNEWPEDLRVREFPNPPASAGGSSKAVRA